MMEINLIDNLDRLVIERDKQNELEKKKREREKQRKKYVKKGALICISLISNLSVVFAIGVFLSFYKVAISSTENVQTWLNAQDLGTLLFSECLLILLLIFVNFCIKQLK